VAAGNANSLQLIGGSGKIEVPMRVVLRYRSMLGVANAVASGIGLAPLPAILFEDPVFKTRLTPVLMNYPLRQSMLYLVYVSRKYLPLSSSRSATSWWNAFRRRRSPSRSPSPFTSKRPPEGHYCGVDRPAGCIGSTRMVSAHAAQRLPG